MSIKNVSLISPFPIQASIKASSKGAEGVLRFTGEANLRSGVLAIKNCNITSGKSSVELSGHLAELKTPTPMVKLHLESKSFDPTMLSFLPYFSALPPDLKLQGALGLSADLSGDTRAPPNRGQGGCAAPLRNKRKPIS